MSFGIWKLVLILCVVLIIFGAGKLPKVMGDIGKGIKSLKEGLKEDEDAPISPTQASSHQQAHAQAHTMKDVTPKTPEPKIKEEEV